MPRTNPEGNNPQNKPKEPRQGGMGRPIKEGDVVLSGKPVQNRIGGDRDNWNNFREFMITLNKKKDPLVKELKKVKTKGRLDDFYDQKCNEFFAEEFRFVKVDDDKKISKILNREETIYEIERLSKVIEKSDKKSNSTPRSRAKEKMEKNALSERIKATTLQVIEEIDNKNDITVAINLVSDAISEEYFKTLNKAERSIMVSSALTTMEENGFDLNLDDPVQKRKCRRRLTDSLKSIEEKAQAVTGVARMPTQSEREQSSDDEHLANPVDNSLENLDSKSPAKRKRGDESVLEVSDQGSPDLSSDDESTSSFRDRIDSQRKKSASKDRGPT